MKNYPTLLNILEGFYKHKKNLLNFLTEKPEWNM